MTAMKKGYDQKPILLQDLLVARWIFDAKPQRHVDIGSRVDGFIAHVAQKFHHELQRIEVKR